MIKKYLCIYVKLKFPQDKTCANNMHVFSKTKGKNEKKIMRKKKKKIM
jgi:hypothetical protein